MKDNERKLNMMCIYNSGVSCDVTIKNGEEIRKCSGCGWNPAVEKARKAKMNAQQFVRDANAPAPTFVIAGAIVNGQNADPVTLRCSKSPMGNLVLKLPGGTIVVPWKTVKDAMGMQK